MKKDVRLIVIEQLSHQYPDALSTVPYQVKSIVDDLETEIFKAIGTMPRHFKSGVYSALAWYRTTPAYITSVITSRGKCNLRGEIVASISVTEKIEAADALASRGLLTSRIKKLLKAKTGRMDTTNG